VKQRHVVVKDVDGGVVVGRDNTDDTGVYRVDAVPQPDHATVAVAVRKKLPNGRVCLRATSPEVKFFPPP
jgi:hypothetical protein